MSESFEKYKQMQTEIENNISLKFHQLLMDNLNATNSARQENQDSEKRLTGKILEVNEKVDRNHAEVKPLLNVFSNVNGAFNVTKWILIGLAAIGAGLTGLYYLIGELKKFWITH